MPGYSRCPLPCPNSTESFWHSQPSTLLQGHRTTRELPKTADIIIIGSGITGASIAHHVFNQDKTSSAHKWKPNVVMLEAREACWGATGRNGGHCQPLLSHHPHDPQIGHFELKNFHAIQSLVNDKRIDCEFVAQPGIRGIYDVETLQEMQHTFNVLQSSAPELARHMRLITSQDELRHYRLSGAVAALYTDVAARLWPYKLVARLLEDLLQNSSLEGRFNLQTLTPVDSFSKHGSGWLVNTSRGTIEAEYVMLATNAYTSHLLPAFADLIVPCRGQMSALRPPSWLSDENRLRTSLGFEGAVMDRYLIQRPTESGEQLMLGGGRQMNLSLGISDDSVIDFEVAMYLRTALPKTIARSGKDAEIELEAEKEWTGIMAWSRDSLPWVGAVPDMPGLYLSAGYTGHGMPNAFLAGKALVSMLFTTATGYPASTALPVAQLETCLPQSYTIDAERMTRARSLDFVDPHNPAQPYIP